MKKDYSVPSKITIENKTSEDKEFQLRLVKETIKAGDSLVLEELQSEEVARVMESAEISGLTVTIEGSSPVPPTPVDPEITSITVTPETELKEPVAVDTKVASLSAEGGTPAYTFELAGEKDDSKFKIEGTEVKAAEELNKGEYTIKVKVVDSKEKEKTSDDITITVAFDIKDITEVFKSRDGEEHTFNKQIKDLQENIAFENTGEGTGKVTGTIKWVTGYTNPAYQEGNVISLHIDGDKLPKGEIKYVFGTTEADPDKNDWNVNLKLNGKDDLTFKIKVDGEVVYTIDLSELVLMPDVTKEMVKEKLEEAASDVNGKMDYAKLSVDDNNKATCSITNGEKKVFEVYQDIISTIFDVLKKNADVFAEITGGGQSIHIKKDSNIDAAELVKLVKAVLPQVKGTTTISELYDQTVDLQVVATDGDTFDWQLEFVDGNN